MGLDGWAHIEHIKCIVYVYKCILYAIHIEHIKQTASVLSAHIGILNNHIRNPKMAANFQKP